MRAQLVFVSVAMFCAAPAFAASSDDVHAALEQRFYVGTYPLTPNFGLRVCATGANLFVQGANQASLELASGRQGYLCRGVRGREIGFARDAGDKVISLTLKQQGLVLQGERH